MSTHRRITGRRPRAPKSRRGGFTLIEAALVTSIISFGVLAMLELLATGTVSNSKGAEQSMGMNIARSVREMCVGMAMCDPVSPTHWGPETGETLATYNDLDDLADKTYSPPIDARRQSMAAYPDWDQVITVQNVDPDRLTVASANGSTPALRVTVKVHHRGREVCTLSWVAFDGN
jgi:hypothetical protein